jgi:hypothetical protein
MNAPAGACRSAAAPGEAAATRFDALSPAIELTMPDMTEHPFVLWALPHFPATAASAPAMRDACACQEDSWLIREAVVALSRLPDARER